VAPSVVSSYFAIEITATNIKAQTNAMSLVGAMAMAQ
jgi:hypothetical protein